MINLLQKSWHTDNFSDIRIVRSEIRGLLIDDQVFIQRIKRINLKHHQGQHKGQEARDDAIERLLLEAVLKLNVTHVWVSGVHRCARDPILCKLCQVTTHKPNGYEKWKPVSGKPFAENDNLSHL